MAIKERNDSPSEPIAVFFSAVFFPCHSLLRPLSSDLAHRLPQKSDGRLKANIERTTPWHILESRGVV